MVDTVTSTGTHGAILGNTGTSVEADVAVVVQVRYLTVFFPLETFSILGTILELLLDADSGECC